MDIIFIATHRAIGNVSLPLTNICYICKITRAIFNLVKAGLLSLMNYIIVYLCVVSSYKEEPCDEAAHW